MGVIVDNGQWTIEKWASGVKICKAEDCEVTITFGQDKVSRIVKADPSVASALTSVASARPSVAFAQPSVAFAQLSVASALTSVASARPSVAFAQLSVASARPSVAFAQPSVAFAQPSLASALGRSGQKSELSVLIKELHKYLVKRRDKKQVHIVKRLKG